MAIGPSTVEWRRYGSACRFRSAWSDSGQGKRLCRFAVEDALDDFDRQARRLGVEKRIIDQEVQLKRIVLYRRLCLLWLVVGNLILIGLVLDANLLIDYSRPGAGLRALNGWVFQSSLLL